MLIPSHSLCFGKELFIYEYMHTHTYIYIYIFMKSSFQKHDLQTSRSHCKLDIVKDTYHVLEKSYTLIYAYIYMNINICLRLHTYSYIYIYIYIQRDPKESLFYLKTPLERTHFHIISYWTSSICSLWHISLEETRCRQIGLLFLISSKGSLICTLPQTGQHILQPLMDHLCTTVWGRSL